ncbi:MAG: cytochrome c, class I [Luminiphilus sp.]|nr:cytochrome c, class I [Luminiphilus sp.]MDG1460215.1 cytochrome c, class I [Luminiphilus sp.]
MARAMVKGLMLTVLGAVCPGLAADDAMNPERAKYHYQMFCQGCHTPDGAGANAIPPLKDFMGYFLRSQRGREFMVRVPGSALSTLDDAELAEVLNWSIDNFAGVSLPTAGYIPYTSQEVAILRTQPLQEIEHHRASVLAEIATLEAQGAES